MYVDILLFENLVINYLLLSITSGFLRIKVSRVKLLLSSVIGALYIMAVFFPALKIFLTLSMKITVSVLMIIIAFAPERFRDFFKQMGTFYIVSFAFGGAAFSLFYFTGRGKVMNGAFYIEDFPVSLLIIAFAVGYILLVYCWDYVRRKALNDELKYDIIIEINNRQAEVKAIIDTGSSLKDPVSNFPVIVAEYNALHDILPNKFSEIFKSNSIDIDFNQLYRLAGGSDWSPRIRLIPFSSLGKQNGMLIGIKPDTIKINTRKCTREIDKVIVGISINRVSNDGEYNALFSPDILK